ncbi:hypothetical protein [Streptomyces sp. enrichment culture]|uniref:hypothetical protein n=1 Tax=Streptomyces sp. enrichment culture TaxID=1795815 RepID=UPI003F570495
MKMVNWFAFGVVFSVMPIIAGLFTAGIRGNGKGLADFIGHGELLIVATGLSAAAAGQAFTMKHTRFAVLPRLLGCGNVLLALLTIMVFADISAAASDLSSAIAATSQKETIKEAEVTKYSLWLFGTALITSFSGALVAELEQ